MVPGEWSAVYWLAGVESAETFVVTVTVNLSVSVSFTGSLVFGGQILRESLSGTETGTERETFTVTVRFKVGSGSNL